MKIIKTTTTVDGVEIVVQRPDGTVYAVSVLPKDDLVLLNFCGIEEKELEPHVEAANQISISLK